MDFRPWTHLGFFLARPLAAERRASSSPRFFVGGIGLDRAASFSLGFFAAAIGRIRLVGRFGRLFRRFGLGFEGSGSRTGVGAGLIAGRSGGGGVGNCLGFQASLPGGKAVLEIGVDLAQDALDLARSGRGNKVRGQLLQERAKLNALVLGNGPFEARDNSLVGLGVVNDPHAMQHIEHRPC